jgi:hypothetical protein
VFWSSTGVPLASTTLTTGRSAPRGAAPIAMMDQRAVLRAPVERRIVNVHARLPGAAQHDASAAGLLDSVTPAPSAPGVVGSSYEPPDAPQRSIAHGSACAAPAGRSPA